MTPIPIPASFGDPTISGTEAKLGGTMGAVNIPIATNKAGIIQPVTLNGKI